MVERFNQPMNSLRSTGGQTVVWAVVSGVILAIVVGVWHRLISSALVLPLILVTIVFVTGVIVGYWFRKQHKTPSVSSTNYLTKMLEADGRLFIALGGLISNHHGSHAFDNALKACVSACCGLLADGARGIIYRPVDGCLEPTADHLMTPNELKRKFAATRDYVTSDVPWGIASAVYQGNQHRVVPFREYQGKWIPLDPEYHVFPEDATGLPYRSFIAIPLRVTPASDCLGVLCLDSMRPDAFDDADLQQYLVNLGLRMAIPMLLYNHSATASDPG